MTVNGLHLALALLAATALTGWFIDARRARRAERQRDIAHRIATEKGRRLMAALAERDAARAHADDAQWLVDAMAAGTRGEVFVMGEHGGSMLPAHEAAETFAWQAARDRHPSQSNVRVLRVVEEQA